MTETPWAKEASTTKPAPMPHTIRIALLDRHALMRAGYRLLLQSRPGMELAGEAGNPEEALALVKRSQPDIILLDLNLDGECNSGFIRLLLQASPEARVIVVTGEHERSLHHAAVQEGAVGLVLKDQPPEVLLKAIEKVHQGEVWLDRVLLAEVLGHFARPQAEPRTRDTTRIALLSPREREVIRWIGQGLKNREIAGQLGISEVTVRHHLTSIFNKLEVEDRLELLIFAYQYNLAELPIASSQ